MNETMRTLMDRMNQNQAKIESAMNSYEMWKSTSEDEEDEDYETAKCMVVKAEAKLNELLDEQKKLVAEYNFQLFQI